MCWTIKSASKKYGACDGLMGFGVRLAALAMLPNGTWMTLKRKVSDTVVPIANVGNKKGKQKAAMCESCERKRCQEPNTPKSPKRFPISFLLPFLLSANGPQPLDILLRIGEGPTAHRVISVLALASADATAALVPLRAALRDGEAEVKLAALMTIVDCPGDHPAVKEFRIRILCSVSTGMLDFLRHGFQCSMEVFNW